MTQRNEQADDPLFVKVVLCSNVFENVTRLITIDDKEPFFLRSGVVPYIWLFGATGSQDFLPVVIRNISKIPTLKVNQDVLSGELELSYQDEIIFHAKKLDSTEVLVDMIQLKQLGFDIWGEPDKLHIGRSVLSRNTFNGMRIGIAIGSGGESGVARS